MRIKELLLSKAKWVLFLTAMMQVTFVAMNVTFIAHGEIIPMLLTGFMISLIWTLNVKRVALGNWLDRITYANGAMFGTGLGYIISHWINRII
jgi:hypothetical protein